MLEELLRRESWSFEESEAGAGQGPWVGNRYVLCMYILYIYNIDCTNKNSNMIYTVVDRLILITICTLMLCYC